MSDRRLRLRSYVQVRGGGVTNYYHKFLCTGSELAQGVIRVRCCHGGTLLTCLPISPIEYRRTHPSLAKIRYQVTGTDHWIDFTDDYGHVTEVCITKNRVTSKVLKEFKQAFLFEQL
jgi:hypothetical protein